jgi:hypothetical protein
MAKRFQRLRYSAEFHGNIPIIAAGDILDRPNPPSELLSWLIDNMPFMYTIPGQHDLPFHSYDARMDAGYGVLVKAKVIEDLPAEEWTVLSNKLAVYAMPWGRYLPPGPPLVNVRVTLAVVHHYIWTTPDSKHAMANMTTHSTSKWSQTAESVDALLFGDNHIQQIAKIAGKPMFNHGGFIPQNADQKDHRPSIGLLMSDKTITYEPWEPESNPQWISTDIPTMPKLSASLVEELEALESKDVDFPAAVRVITTKAKREGTKVVLDTIAAHLLK